MFILLNWEDKFNKDIQTLAKIKSNMKIYIKKDSNYYYPVLYTLKVIEKNKQFNFNFVDSPKEADLIWDHLHSNSQVVALFFYAELEKKKPNLLHYNLFKEDQIIRDERGENDLIATIFYMINCLQELSLKEGDLDKFGRYKFESSYQYKFNSIEINLVQKYIDQIVDLIGIKGRSRKSSFFISHDIDKIYGSLLEDGFWALKNLRIDVILTLLANEFIRKPHWKNIDKIIQIDSEYDVRSTFFWLVNKGKGISNIKNADYSIRKEQKLLKLIEDSGFVNGLHKSCSEMSIDDEINKGNLNTTFKRDHYLKFLPHKDWIKVSESNINFDASLGFVERYGFRNSYGGTFQPYNISEKKPYDFVEAPLNFMDNTFHKYMKINQGDIGEIVIDFFEKNKENCLFSLIWHNNYFTDYKYNSFLKEYKKVLSYIYENKVDCLTPQEIVNENMLTW